MNTPALARFMLRHFSTVDGKRVSTDEAARAAVAYLTRRAACFGGAGFLRFSVAYATAGEWLRLAAEIPARVTTHNERRAAAAQTPCRAWGARSKRSRREARP